MEIIIFSFEDAVIWGENWQKYPTTYTWKITTWAFIFRHCHEELPLVPGWLSAAWSGTGRAALNTCSCFKLFSLVTAIVVFFPEQTFLAQKITVFPMFVQHPLPTGTFPTLLISPSLLLSLLPQELGWQRRSEQATLEKQSTKIRRAFF